MPILVFFFNFKTLQHFGGIFIFIKIVDPFEMLFYRCSKCRGSEPIYRNVMKNEPISTEKMPSVIGINMQQQPSNAYKHNSFDLLNMLETLFFLSDVAI